MPASLLGYADVLDTLTDLQDTWEGNATAIVGTNVEYAPYQELGTATTPPQPHLRPAVEDMQRRADAIAAQANSAEEVVKLLALDVEIGTKRLAPVDTGNLRNSYRTILDK